MAVIMALRSDSILQRNIERGHGRERAMQADATARSWRAAGWSNALTLLLAAGLVGMPAPAAASGAEPTLRLHVPSPDWRDQVIYFVLIDRFDDGDPDNNDQGAGEFDPADRRRYSGGDLAGLTRRLDYIQGLGASAVWITPPVAHQWWDGQVGYGGYHGYWGADFKAVDPHFGSLADYQRLSHALHSRGMYLVQDIVVNHVGNFFSYAEAPDPARPARGHRRNPDSRPMAAPLQAPFDRNDARRRRDRRAGIYHWTPAIVDFNAPMQEHSWQLADLDDLATGNPVVRRALRDSYGHWIGNVGVDAFRVDTAFYVEPGFFADFLHAQDGPAPGVLAVARATGRQDFHVFGEGFGIDRPFQDLQARKIEAWSSAPDGSPLLPAMINFPLYGSLLDVFTRGQPAAVLGHRIDSMMRVHARPHLMPSFVDNHDVDRFLASGTPAALRQAVLALMTLPGIPVIYYGTEQGLREPRAAMFAAGHGGRAGRFDPQAPMYRYLQRAIALRRGHRVLSRGQPTVLAGNRAGPGAVAWRMDDADDRLVVALNSAGHRSLLHAPATGLAPGTVLRGLFAIDSAATDAVVDATGGLSLALPAHAGLVWQATDQRASADASGASLALTALRRRPSDEDLQLTGRAAGLGQVTVVVDGDLDRAQVAAVDRHGRWQARLDTGSMVDPAIEHSVQAWSADPPATSAVRAFRVARQWQQLVAVDDPIGDDVGRDGRYRYPTDPGWRGRQLDLHGARLDGSGGSLRIAVRMNAISAGWNPANGFDRVAFAIHIELPGRDGGVSAMPLQRAHLPDGMRWHYRLRVGGWSNVLFSADGADAGTEGMPVAGAAAIDVDPATSTIGFSLPARALGHPASLAGARVHVSTWDWDAGWRRLAPEPESHAFGGGGDGDPLIMDELLLAVPTR